MSNAQDAEKFAITIEGAEFTYLRSKEDESILTVRYSNEVSGEFKIPSNWRTTRIMQFIVSIAGFE